VWQLCELLYTCYLLTYLLTYSKNQRTSLWNFVPNSAAASRSCRQQNSSSSSTVELVDDTRTTVDESWLFTTSRSTVTLQLRYCDLLRICCTACFYSRQDFDRHGASRGPSAVAELLVRHRMAVTDTCERKSHSRPAITSNDTHTCDLWLSR